MTSDKDGNDIALDDILDPIPTEISLESFKDDLPEGMRVLVEDENE